MMILLCLTSFFLLFPPCVNQVIVRDIVGKNVIAQFRAHKSPISALCFDPSGMLLVTASVQGHNINIFKIMPGLEGSSSACDAGTSYVHLYRLQRGLTNAVSALSLFHNFLLQLESIDPFAHYIIYLFFPLFGSRLYKILVSVMTAIGL